MMKRFDKPSLVSHVSVRISGQATSIALEPEFENALGDIAGHLNMNRSKLVTLIDIARMEHGVENLSSAVRVYILEQMRHAAETGEPKFSLPRLMN